MPTTNIKIFDENKANIMSDTDYASAAQRLNGVQAGIASSALQNKTLLQTSIICYAVAQLMVNNGFDALDTATTTVIANNLASSVMGKVSDRATQAEATAGTSAVKWISPLTLSQVFTDKKATQGEVTSLPASNDTHWTSPLNLQQFFNSRAATDSDIASRTTTKWVSPAGLYTWFLSASVRGDSSDINAGTESNKWVPPSSIKTWFDSLAKASTLDAQAGTNDAKWMSPLKVKQAIDKFVPAGSIGTVYNQNKKLGTLRTNDNLTDYIFTDIFERFNIVSDNFSKMVNKCETYTYIVWFGYSSTSSNVLNDLMILTYNKNNGKFDYFTISGMTKAYGGTNIWCCSDITNISNAVYVRYSGPGNAMVMHYISLNSKKVLRTIVDTRYPNSYVKMEEKGNYTLVDAYISNANTNTLTVDYIYAPGTAGGDIRSINFNLGGNASWVVYSARLVFDPTDVTFKRYRLCVVTVFDNSNNYRPQTVLFNFDDGTAKNIHTYNELSVVQSSRAIALPSIDKTKIVMWSCNLTYSFYKYCTYDVATGVISEIKTVNTYGTAIQSWELCSGTLIDYDNCCIFQLPYSGQDSFLLKEDGTNGPKFQNITPNGGTPYYSYIYDYMFVVFDNNDSLPFLVNALTGEITVINVPSVWALYNTEGRAIITTSKVDTLIFSDDKHRFYVYYLSDKSVKGFIPNQ